MQSIVKELQTKVDKSIRFPTGYYVNYGGAFENLNAAKQRLLIAVPVSLVLIFLLLFFWCNHYRSLEIYMHGQNWKQAFYEDRCQESKNPVPKIISAQGDPDENYAAHVKW